VAIFSSKAQADGSAPAVKFAETTEVTHWMKTPDEN
jgi:hypothetical protein